VQKYHQNRAQLLLHLWQVQIKNIFSTKNKSSRTQDINDCMRAVQRSIAYDRKVSQAGTRLTVSRAEPIGTDDLMEQMCNDNYEYSQMAKNEQSRHPEEPDTEYLLEHNVRQNFGTEKQSSAKWYKYSENSQRHSLRFLVIEKVMGTKLGLIKTNLVY
jgi:transglutaminase/protease-like cytokinesis protein 3